MPPEEEKELIRKGIKAIQNVCGFAPKGWYYGRLSPRSHALVWDVYREMGLPLLWNSDCYDDDVPYWVDVPVEKDSSNPEGMLMIPYSFDCNDYKFHLDSGFSSPMDFYDQCKNTFDILYEEGEEGTPKMMSIGLHCRVMGKPGRLAALKKFVEYVAAKEDVWVATRTQIAEHFREKFPYKKGQRA
jgi:peptidoglycan/xylan/chitin deacetylase (PgdA/CDA1 family)